MYKLQPFRFWCQKVLPLVYDDSLSYYELLCKVVDYLNKNIDAVNDVSEAVEKLYEYVEHYFDEELQEYVDAKLDEMVTDGTLNDILIENLNIPVNMFPFTKGSVVLDYKYAPSSYGRFGNTLYILSFNRGGDGEAGDIGMVTEVDLNNNIVVGNKERYLCHANSCCSVPDRSCHYVVLGWMYESDGVTHREVTGLAKYDNTFDNYNVVCSGQHFTGVTYDRIANKVYAWDRVTDKIFEIDENDNAVLLGNVVNPNRSAYNQGFAAHNGFGYICGNKGQYFKFRMDTLQTLYYGNVMLIDGSRSYILDELEDWEFNANEELMCIMYSKLRNFNSFGIYTQIGMAKKRVKMPNSVIANPAFTASINETTIRRFDNNESSFKHPNEVYISTHIFNTISIATDRNFGNVVIGRDTVFNRSLVCDTLNLRCANVTFTPNYRTDDISIGVINVAHRGARISFGGANGVHYNIGNIVLGDSKSLLVFGSGTEWDNTVFDDFEISSPVVSTFMICDDVLIGPCFTRGFNDTIVVPANGTASFSEIITLPFSSAKSNWRFFAEYIPSTTPLVTSFSHSQNGKELTATINFYNPTNNDVTLTTIRYNLINECTFT